MTCFIRTNVQVSTDTKEVIVSKLSELVLGLWDKIGDKFLTKADSEELEDIIAAAFIKHDKEISAKQDSLGIDSSTGDVTKFLNQKGKWSDVPNEIVIIDNTYSVQSVLDLILAGKTPVYHRSGSRFLQMYKYQSNSSEPSVTFSLAEISEVSSTNPVASAPVLQILQSTVNNSGWSDNDKNVLSNSNKVESITSSNNDTLHFPTTKAVTEYVGQAISGVGGKLISNSGNPFSSYSNLPSSTPYSGVNIYSNDYAFVQTTTTVTRYSATVSGSSVSWTKEYSIDSSAFTTIPISFTEDSSVANIATGETLPVILGKIAKWYISKISALGSLAFLNQVGDAQITGTISDSHIASASTWSGKQNALPYVSGKYGIDISGTATYASNAASGSELAQAILPNSDVELITGSTTFSNALTAYNGGKKLYYVASGGTGVEYRVPLTYVMFQNTTPKAFVFQYVQDDHVDANQVGVVVVNKLTSSGWAAQTSLTVGYATSAGSAGTAGTSTYSSYPVSGSVLAKSVDCILTYGTTASTAFDQALAAYTAGQKIYCLLGGSYEDNGVTYTYEKKVQLSYITFASGHVVGFAFKDVLDGNLEGSTNKGAIQTAMLRSTAWSLDTVIPAASDTANLAGNAYKWNGYELAVGTVGGAGYISYV
jgi:hypothetical protein